MNPTRFLAPAFASLLLWAPAPGIAQPGTTVLHDIEYARVDGHVLRLDLHRPPGRPRPPLILWVHGGAWRSGSKSDMPLAALVADGHWVASVDYRLSTQARFPAQVHDLKAALRFLRSPSSPCRAASRMILAAGNSAGGHLAALVGVSNGHGELEGHVGDHLNQSSNVQGILSLYGASNLTTILSQSTPHGLSVRIPALELLLGARPGDAPELARLASPVHHVDRHDPPLLLLHGDQDPQMPVNQSLELDAAYRRAGARSEFVLVPGAAHGGPQFLDADRLAVIRRFLRSHFETGRRSAAALTPGIGTVATRHLEQPPHR